MSTKHTPGPCAAISRHNDVVNIETTSGTILGMSMKTDRLTPEEVQANATLWAAAPGMLEVCEAIVAWDIAAGPEGATARGAVVKAALTAILRANDGQPEWHGQPSEPTLPPEGSSTPLSRGETSEITKACGKSHPIARLARRS